MQLQREIDEQHQVIGRLKKLTGEVVLCIEAPTETSSVSAMPYLVKIMNINTHMSRNEIALPPTYNTNPQ